MPAGKGVWPAFWLIGLDRSDVTAELDVVEYYGHDNTRFSSVWHIWRKNAGDVSPGDAHHTAVPPNSLSDEFHLYGVEITPFKVTFYFDRKAIWQIDAPPEYKRPFYPLVNLALGSGWPIDETPNPSFLWVDYIHIYQRRAGL
jgi:beta-glucanase (GH16 family)